MITTTARRAVAGLAGLYALRRLARSGTHAAGDASAGTATRRERDERYAQAVARTQEGLIERR